MKICRWQKYLDGSRIYREFIGQTKSLENWLDGSKNLSRFYQEETQKSRWIENAIRSIEKRRKKGSIKDNLSRICQEVVELEENEFFKEEKHKEMNATSKLLNQRSNQHIKLSKHLSTNMQSIHRSKTHTHTPNKFNQFYISKTS